MLLKSAHYGYDNNRRVSYQTSGASPNCVYTKYGRDLDGDITAVVRDKDSDCSHSQVVTKTTSYTPTKKVNTVTDEMGYQTLTAYDGDDRPQLITQWLNSNGSSTRVTRTDYDAAGQTHDVIKGYGNPDQFTYATYAYFPNGEVQSVLDANNNQTSSTYDGYDRLSTLTFANGSTEQYGYDNNGNLTSRKNRDGVSLSFGYDVLNREISRTVPPNAAFTVTRTLSSQYDLASRKWNLAVTEGSTSQALQYGYDTAGRLSYVNDGLLNTLQPGSAIGNVSYGYDGNSNRTLLAVYTNGASWIPTYNYDTLERLSSITSGSYTMDRFGFDGLSRLASETFLDTSSVAYGYQDNDDLTSLTHNYYGGSLTLGYTTNGAHQIVSQTSSDLSFLSPPGGAASQAYSPNNLNQYSSVAGASLGYDGNGNLTGNNGWTYGYDEENRLRTASGNGHSVSYAYDPLGRRRSKTVDGLTTYFISDGANELAETDASGNRQRLYVYADGTDNRVAMYTDALGNWDFYHTDHQGSTLMMSRWVPGGANNGMSDGSFHYDPYGVAAASDPSTGNPFRYTGRYLDAETGLYYYRARYYSPALGRFLQTDPIGSKDDLNLYTYAGGDPVDKVDPTGLEGTGVGGCPHELCPYAVNNTSGGQQNSDSGEQLQGTGKSGDTGPAVTVTASRQSSAPNIQSNESQLFDDILARGVTVSLGGNLLLMGGGDGVGGLAGLFRGAAAKTAVVAPAIVKEGIYEFTAASGKTYVGQSGNIATRISQHLSSGKFLSRDISSLKTTEVLGGKTAREIAEQLRINKLGGVSNLENILNPIGPARQYLLPVTP